MRGRIPILLQRELSALYPGEPKAHEKGNREEAEQIAGQIRDLVCSTYGHTLVLFTSYTLMGSVQQLLRDQIPFPMVQVWRNSQEEIARFKKMENAVLFAAGSCWEGVDFPGDMVSSLIIVKLPFSVPDPIMKPRGSSIDRWNPTSRLSWCRICRRNCARDSAGQSAQSRTPALCLS